MSLKEDIEKHYNLHDAEAAYQQFKNGEIIVTYFEDIYEVKVFVFRESIFKYNTYFKMIHMEEEDDNMVREFFKGIERIDFKIDERISNILNDIDEGKPWDDYYLKDGKYYKTHVFPFYKSLFYNEEITREILITEIMLKLIQNIK